MRPANSTSLGDVLLDLEVSSHMVASNPRGLRRKPADVSSRETANLTMGVPSHAYSLDRT